MGCNVIRLLLIVLFSSLTTNMEVGDEPIIWDRQLPVLKVSGPQIPVSIPDIDTVRTTELRRVQSSNKKASSQPNVFININNFFCVPGMQEVDVDPIQTHIFNIAVGNQEITSPHARDIACSSQERTATIKPIFEQSNKDAQWRVLSAYGQQSHGYNNPECRGRYEYLNSRNGFPKSEWDIFQKRISKIPQTSTINSKTNYEEYCQLKDPLSRNDGIYKSVSEIDSVMESQGLSPWVVSPKIGTNHERFPNIQLFIGGKRINEPQDRQNDKASSNNFTDAVDGSSLTQFVAGNTGIGRKSTPCDNDGYLTCTHDVIIFREGFQLTYGQIEIIFEEITERPEGIKLIVPGKITGPLFNYFQHVESRHHEPALLHGVCLLSNGFLVPIKTMMSLVQLHGWLSTLNQNFTSESFRLLHASPWTDMNSVLGIMRCLIRSGKVMVLLPSNQKIPYDGLEQQGHPVPDTLQEQMEVEVFGFSISYVVFKKGFLELCDTIKTSHSQ